MCRLQRRLQDLRQHLRQCLLWIAGGRWARPPPDPRHVAGRRAEDQALRLLRAHGLKLMARNVRNRHGELDLIMQDASAWIVVEVRWRTSRAFGGAAASIGPAKQARLVRCTQCWLAGCGQPARPVRFDVVLFEAGQARWLRDAMQVDASQRPAHIARRAGRTGYRAGTVR